MSTMKFRNDSGGQIVIPKTVQNPDGRKAVLSLNRVEDGKTFSAEVDDQGVPVHPTFAVLHRADLIVPATAAKPKRGPGRPPKKKPVTGD